MADDRCSAITENGIQQLMDQMFLHGLLTLEEDVEYVGNSSHLMSKKYDDDDDDVIEKDSLEAFRRWEHDRSNKAKSQQQRQSTSLSSSKEVTNSSVCRLIPTLSNDCYYTPDGIRKAVFDVLVSPPRPSSGRMTLADMAKRLNVHEKSLQTTTGFSSNYDDDDNHNDDSDDLSPRKKAVLRLMIGGRTELFAWSYWDRISNEIYHQLEEEDDGDDDDGTIRGGCLSILELSKRYDLPVEIFQSFVLSHPKFNSSSTTVLDDSMRIVTTKFIQRLKHDAQLFFSSLEEPMTLYAACQKHEDWDMKLLVAWIDQDEDFQKGCKGDFHCDHVTSGIGVIINTAASTSATPSAAAGGGGIFVPKVHQQQQQKGILDYISVNGYITAERANQIQGVSVSDMIQIVQNEYGTLATVVKDDDSNSTSNSMGVVIVLDHFLQAIQVAVHEYLDTNTSSSSSSLSPSTATTEALDLQEYISPELMQSPSLVSKLLTESGLSTSYMSENGGIVIVVNDEAIVVRYDFIQHLHDVTIPRLIEEYALGRAEELITNSLSSGGLHDEDENMHDDDLHETTKSGKFKSNKGKRGKTKKHKTHYSQKKTTSFDVVPLYRVADSILHEFPSFLPDHFTESYDASHLPNVEWETGTIQNEHESNDDGSSDLLVAFCRRALYTDRFISRCEQAVNAELRRLQSEKQSKATLSRKDAAAKVRSVEAAFEDVFTDLCLLIQAQAKFIRYVEGSSFPSTNEERLVDILTDELLFGPCADLTSRITQNAFFKEEEDSLFTFLPPELLKKQDKRQGETSHLPIFCADVDISARLYPKTFLSCPPPRDPLPVLRESFSGNIGVALARQWIHCGGHCYRGGVIRSSLDDDSGDSQDEQEHVRPGSLDDFISHIEANSLSLCGLPFKNLDKKAEKNFLFSRKQKLTSLLSQTATIDAATVLDLTIMLLYQQVKQFVVCGSLLRGSILKALIQERKIPSIVGEALEKLDEKILNNEIDEDLVILVRECAVCRDISKHDVSKLESYLSSNR
jgi:E3 UFM1-protein ligase 1